MITRNFSRAIKAGLFVSHIQKVKKKKKQNKTKTKKKKENTINHRQCKITERLTLETVWSEIAAATVTATVELFDVHDFFRIL